MIVYVCVCLHVHELYVCDFVYEKIIIIASLPNSSGLSGNIAGLWVVVVAIVVVTGAAAVDFGLLGRPESNLCHHQFYVAYWSSRRKKFLSEKENRKEKEEKRIFWSKIEW